MTVHLPRALAEASERELVTADRSFLQRVGQSGRAKRSLTHWVGGPVPRLP